jgi:hypothetical protein
MTDAVMEQNDKRTALGTLLIERGFLDQIRLDEALRIGDETGERLGEVVVRLGWASEDDLAKVLADQWHLRYFERSAISFDGRALRRMSREDATRLEALPIQETDEGVVVVALAEPTDARLLALRELLGDRIDFVVVAKTAIDVGLRSELLAKNGTTPTTEEDNVEAVDVVDETSGQFAGFGEAPAPRVREVEPIGHQVDMPISPAFDSEVASTDFDDVAKTLSDALMSQLSALRAIVVDAESKHAQDRQEIERLESELAGRTSEVEQRNESIRSMQQKLREFADTLDQS